MPNDSEVRLLVEFVGEQMQQHRRRDDGMRIGTRVRDAKRIVALVVVGVGERIFQQRQQIEQIVFGCCDFFDAIEDRAIGQLQLAQWQRTQRIVTADKRRQCVAIVQIASDLQRQPTMRCRQRFQASCTKQAGENRAKPRTVCVTNS